MKDQLKMTQSTAATPAKTNRFELYPNPVSESFTLKYTVQQSGRLQLVDLLGRIVHEQELTDLIGRLQVNTKDFSGIYFVNIIRKDGQSIYRQRITVVK